MIESTPNPDSGMSPNQTSSDDLGPLPVPIIDHEFVEHVVSAGATDGRSAVAVRSRDQFRSLMSDTVARIEARLEHVPAAVAKQEARGRALAALDAETLKVSENVSGREKLPLIELLEVIKCNTLAAAMFGASYLVQVRLVNAIGIFQDDAQAYTVSMMGVAGSAFAVIFYDRTPPNERRAVLDRYIRAGRIGGRFGGLVGVVALVTKKLIDAAWYDNLLEAAFYLAVIVLEPIAASGIYIYARDRVKANRKVTYTEPQPQVTVEKWMAESNRELLRLKQLERRLRARLQAITDGEESFVEAACTYFDAYANHKSTVAAVSACEGKLAELRAQLDASLFNNTENPNPPSRGGTSEHAKNNGDMR